MWFGTLVFLINYIFSYNPSILSLYLDRFLKYKISFSDFSHNPSLIENPRLVLRIYNKWVNFFFPLALFCTISSLYMLSFMFPFRFYNWATAAPILLCMQVFNRMLPQVQ